MARDRHFGSLLGTYLGPVGTVTLVAGAGTVTTVMQPGDQVFYARQSSGGTAGTVTTYTVNTTVSFTIVSNNVLDTSVFSYAVVRKF